jgi:hypothetical protein
MWVPKSLDGKYHQLSPRKLSLVYRKLGILDSARIFTGNYSIYYVSHENNAKIQISF